MLQRFTYFQQSLQVNTHALSSAFDYVCILDSNKQVNTHAHIHSAKLIAIGAAEELIVQNEGSALEQLQRFRDVHSNWLFGYLSYELKNEIETLSSGNHDGLAFPALHFFVPKLVIEIEGNDAIVHYDDTYLDKAEAGRIVALAFSGEPTATKTNSLSGIRSRISKEQYIDAVNALQQHIRLGDIYEVNFCQEFYDDKASIDPASVFEQLNAISEAPFAAFCKLNDHYAICSSPERFLRKENNRLISQPIKGTIRRSADSAEDEHLKQTLRNDPKEQNENVMIVDLVRNDLSRIAKRGSVSVDELFGIYSFRQVHQMISTVSCEVKDDRTFSDILRATFPMGSMTGAPKVRAMQLIEQYESTKRGLYSGAIGYVRPNGDFDFNVVIRSILYNARKHYLSFMVGSAITSKAEAEAEYEECLLKAKALFRSLVH